MHNLVGCFDCICISSEKAVILQAVGLACVLLNQIVTTNILIILLCFAVSMVATWAVYPLMFRFATRHRIEDYPAKRKLQQHPVPVLGGATIAVGMIIPLIISIFCLHWHISAWSFLFILIMLIMGVVDDIRDLPVVLRFCLEMAVVGIFICADQTMIDSFHGLWGVTDLPLWVSIPLSIIAGVGIINSINMIDGVDGYSSGFCMMVCLLFAILFACAGEYALCCLMAICIGAMIPFFLHNVFGLRTKMYIGDGGTLMFGAIMSCAIFYILQSDSPVDVLQDKGFSPVAFCLAVLCIPVFDTVRVMCSRIARGVSPFSPDRTHLHHLFLELGFSHIGTATALILTNLFIVSIWWVSYAFGATQEVQLYVVLALGILSTFVFSMVVRKSIRREDGIYRFLSRIGQRSHIENSVVWTAIQRYTDGKNNITK